ncbi:MAG: type II secretion system protein GspM, partial [Proteobacteria bacterium]|nr:type II secretion system protein GspM [Pseudomonadota bacterium]
MKWFEKLTSQEQKLIKLGLIILLPVIMWKLIYSPITQSYQTKQRQLVSLLSQYKEMQSSKSALKSASKV